MTLPLIILCGQAGSGKDSLALAMTEKYGGVSLALADPIKRIAHEVFQFTEDQLWGASELRNAPMANYHLRDLDDAGARLNVYARKWCQRLFPRMWEHARDKLVDWYHEVRGHFMKTGELTPRYVLQTLGTEWGRALDGDVWVKYAREQALRLLGGGLTYNRLEGLTDVKGAVPPNFIVITDGRFANEVIRIKEVGGQAIQVIRPGSGAAAMAAGVQGHASETSLAGVPAHFFDFVVKNDGDIFCLRDKGRYLVSWRAPGLDHPISL